MSKAVNISPLLACLRNERESIKKFSADEWNEVVRQAAHHRIAPYVYHRVKEFHQHTPKEILKTLQSQHSATAIRNLQLLSELSVVLKELRSTSIPVIALKGVHLATSVYEDVSLRPMVDIDLLVRQNDISAVENILRRLRYSPQEPDEHEPWSHHHLPRFVREASTPFEIHWTVPPSHPFTIDVNDLWNKAHTATIAGEEVKVLSPETSLITLSLHAAFHHRLQSGLRPLIDVAECVRKFGDEIRWDELPRVAAKWRASRCVALTLALTKNLIGAPIDDNIIRKLNPSIENSQLLEWASSQVLTRRKSDETHSPVASQLLGSMSLTSKSSLLRNVLFPPRHAIATMYKLDPTSPVAYFYYPVRMKDLLLQHSRGMWNMLRGDAQARQQAQMYQQMVDE